jgi:hypothetical protein
MRWLREGGKEVLYKVIDEVARKVQELGLLGIFSASIWLPCDVVVEARFKNGGGVFWTFSWSEREEAEKFADLLRKKNPNAEINVMTAKEYMGIDGENIMTDFDWHGDDGASIIFQTISQILSAVEEADEVVRLEVIRDLGLEEPVKLPFFAPKMDEDEVLQFALEWCEAGSYLIFPGGRVLKRVEDGFQEAGSEDVIELTLLRSKGSDFRRLIEG